MSGIYFFIFASCESLTGLQGVYNVFSRNALGMYCYDTASEHRCDGILKTLLRIMDELRIEIFIDRI